MWIIMLACFICKVIIPENLITFQCWLCTVRVAYYNAITRHWIRSTRAMQRYSWCRISFLVYTYPFWIFMDRWLMTCDCFLSHHIGMLSNDYWRGGYWLLGTFQGHVSRCTWSSSVKTLHQTPLLCQLLPFFGFGYSASGIIDTIFSTFIGGRQYM